MGVVENGKNINNDQSYPFRADGWVDNFDELHREPIVLLL